MLFDPVNDSYILFSVSKVIDTFVGVVTGFLVNYFIFPPRREKVLVGKYRQILKDFIDKLGELLEKEGDVHISPLVSELNAITDETLTIEADHHFMKHQVNESDIWDINILYKLFSLITQLIDKKQIVPLSEKLAFLGEIAGTEISNSALRIKTNNMKEFLIPQLLNSSLRLKK